MEDERESGLAPAPDVRVGGDVRARYWDELVGQTEMKRRLDLRIRAAVAADRPLGHTLLVAPPGFGKTTLAGMIAFRLGRAFKPFVAPVAVSALIDVMAEHQDEGLVLFIDEVHLSTKREQEDLLPLLEEGFLETGNGRVYHNNLTVLCGTTRREKVIPALLDRFPIKPTFADYDDDDMTKIVLGMSERLGGVQGIDDEVAHDLGLATGGTPRNARGLVEAARDLSELGFFTSADVIDLCGVTPDGLDETQVRYLEILADTDRGKLGLNPLAARLQMATVSVESLERLLLVRGYVDLAVGGRELTDAGRARVASIKRGKAQ